MALWNIRWQTRSTKPDGNVEAAGRDLIEADTPEQARTLAQEKYPLCDVSVNGSAREGKIRDCQTGEVFTCLITGVNWSAISTNLGQYSCRRYEVLYEDDEK